MGNLLHGVFHPGDAPNLAHGLHIYVSAHGGGDVVEVKWVRRLLANISEVFHNLPRRDAGEVEGGRGGHGDDVKPIRLPNGAYYILILERGDVENHVLRRRGGGLQQRHPLLVPQGRPQTRCPRDVDSSDASTQEVFNKLGVGVYVHPPASIRGDHRNDDLHRTT